MSKKTILITGASSEIGQELIKTFAPEVTVIAHCSQGVDVLSRLKDSAQCKVIPVKADFCNEGEVDSFINISESHGPIHQIVHLAATRIEHIRFKDFDCKKFEKELDVSLRSIIKILHCFLPQMVKARQGKVVVLLSSVVKGLPPKALSSYTVSKYALLGLVKSLVSEYASHNIQINAVSPSLMDTQFVKNLNPRVIELAADANPMKRNATIQDVVPVLELLLSETSNYLSGVNIPVTGGELVD